MKTKIAKKYGEDIYGISYQMEIENGILKIALNNSQKKNLQFEYRLFDISVLMSKKGISNDKSCEFILSKFGKYRIRVYVAEKNKNISFSFLTEYIDFNEYNAYETLNPKKSDYLESLDRIKGIYNQFVKENDEILNMVYKIQTTGEKLVKYFQEKGINTLNLYGNQDQKILTRLIWMNLNFQESFKVEKLLSRSLFVDKFPLANTDLIFEKIGADKAYQGSAILVCEATKNNNLVKRLQEQTGAQIFVLSDIINELFNLDIKSSNQEKNDTYLTTMVDKIQAINSLSYNIMNYFKRQNIKEISIFVDKNEAILGRLMWISIRYLQNFNFKYLLSTQNFKDTTVVPRGRWLKYTKLKADKTFNDEDIILVCGSQKDKTIMKYLSKKTGAKIIHLVDLVNLVLPELFIIDPLIKIKENNPGVNIILGNLPLAKKIINKSDNERFIVESAVDVNTIREQLALDKPIIPEALKKFNYDIEYVRDILNTFYRTKKDDIERIEDMQSKYVNVINNFRLTTDQPQKYDRTVYLFGNSVTFGIGSEDRDTIPSFLQRLFNEKYKDAKMCVFNCANHSSGDYDYQFELMNTIDFKPGDVIISLMHQNVSNIEQNGLITYNFQHDFERPHDMGEVFIDRTHVNSIANKRIAEILLKIMKDNKILSKSTSKKVEKKSVINTKTIEKVVSKDELPELKKYKDFLLANKANTKSKNIGAIVMNCNPFTLGHRYLIETAAKKVAHLYIFAVEEDKSYFPFKERIKLMKDGTKDLENVTVLPSGKFIISQLTFSDYFNKEKLSDKTINMSDDVTIFAEEIAPVLGITKRYVGDEPLCNVTRQYNNTMNMILPKYGIHFEIIQRKESGGAPISASRVRKLLEEQNFDEIKTIVPITTYNYLKKKYQK